MIFLEFRNYTVAETRSSSQSLPQHTLGGGVINPALGDASSTAFGFFTRDPRLRDAGRGPVGVDISG